MKQNIIVYTENIDFKRFNAKEIYVLMHIFNLFKNEKYPLSKNTPSTYEDAYRNQTLHFTYKSLSHIEPNRGRLKLMLDKFTKCRILEKIEDCTYLINPLYAEYGKQDQESFMDQINNKVFFADYHT